MTDTTNAPQASAPAPAAAPAPVETSATPTPVTTEAPKSDPDFDQNWRDFLGHDFGDPDPAPAAPAAPTPSAAASPAPIAPAGVAPPVDPAGAPASPSPVQANGGLTPPANTGQEGTSPQVDPNLLMAVLNGGTPAPAAPAAPTATPPASPAPTAPSGTEPQQAWEPFAANFQLPPQLTEALFRSEDPQQQGQALVGLLASFGNAIAQTMEDRIATFHAPRMQEQFTAATTQHQQAAAVHADFYGTHDDLKPYTQIVKRAGEIFFAQNPGATWSPENRDKVAELARAAARQLGATLPARTQAAAPVAVSPGTVAVQPGYVAGGARPESLGMPEDQDSPGAILEQLTAWG